jgi:hypothetical protein
MVTLQFSTSVSPRRRVLIIPSSIMLIVLHLAGPAPRLSNPLTRYKVTICGCRMEVITPSSCGGSSGLRGVDHVDSKAINFPVFESVTCQKVVFRCVSSVFELALDADVDPEWD